MPLNTGDTIGILADNLRLRSSVLPIPVKNATAWTKGLDLPRGGKQVLYTGQMYQLIPYIEDLVSVEEKLGDSFLARFSGFGRQVNKILSIASFMAHPSKAERSVYDRIPRNVATLLRRAGVSFGALFEDDLYSGALIYDVGADDVLKAHAQKVQAVFAKYGVEEVITIDPHTTNMLRSVYPSILENYNIKVRNYLEVLAELDLVPNRTLADEVVIHDSCIFARYEGVLDAPRRLLEAAGLNVRDPEHSGTSTWCCGGPVESLYPKKASEQAMRRVDELRLVSDTGVTMCPLCYINLQKAAKDAIRFDDISDYLLRAFEA